MLETPNTPRNVQMNKSAPYMLSVTWDAPENYERFDLEHFKVHIMLPEQETYIANGTSMIPEYRFHSDVIPSENNNIHIRITAVSKCSQQHVAAPLRPVAHSIRILSEWRENPGIIAGLVTRASSTVSNSESEKDFGDQTNMNGKFMVTLNPLFTHMSSVLILH